MCVHAGRGYYTLQLSCCKDEAGRIAKNPVTREKKPLCVGAPVTIEVQPGAATPDTTSVEHNSSALETPVQGTTFTFDVHVSCPARFL